MTIQVLKDHVVNRIAAGEVVDRPASIVRELVDNAVDAGATEIRIWLENGGRSLIRVRDDGKGMCRNDALLAFERHATSKLSSAEDLDRIETMGFRGEALASISAVSKVTLRTVPADDPIGTEVVIYGGQVRSVEDVSGARGSDFRVKGLFYNTPARRKFLSSAKAEERRIKQWVLQSSLGQPNIRYQLTFDGREVLHLPTHKTEGDRAKSLFQGNYVPVNSDGDRVQLQGVVGHPGMAQSKTGSFVFLVNGRLVSDSLLLRAVKDGFDSTLKEREFPVGYLSIRVLPEEVDVNVHPQKAEVRFRDGRALFALVRDQVQQAVRSFRSPVAGGSLDANLTERSWLAQRERPAVSEPVVQTNLALQPLAVAAASSTVPLSALSSTSSQVLESELEPPFSPQGVDTSDDSAQMMKAGASRFEFSALRYIGQALQCYLFCEHEERVYCIDMHAAHERYNYNLIRNQFRTRAVSSQQLLLPQDVFLTETGADLIEQHLPLLESFGFDVERIGPADVVVRAVPAFLRDGDIPSLLKEFAASPFGEIAESRMEEYVDHVAARLACHASIRSGKVMSREEVYALFAALDTTEFSAACPHGRPVVVSFSEFEVERWFGRDR